MYVNIPYIDIDCLGSVEVVPKALAWETKKQLQRLTEIPSTTDRHWTVTVTVYKRRNSRKTKRGFNEIYLLDSKIAFI